jgi:dTDP-4-dehydrorhamnose 3,5-epimerase-like enzyme
VIPPNVWHGSYNFTNEPAILVYFITQKYDGADEERATVEEIGFDWSRPIK